MSTVTIGVSSLGDARQRLAGAFRNEPQGERISFTSIELLWKTLSPRRWEVVQTLTGQGPLAIREVARRLGRDVKAVHGDITALISAGVVERTESGVSFPYDAVHVDFMLTKAA